MKTIAKAAQDLLDYGNWDFTEINWCGIDQLELTTDEKKQYANHIKLELQAMIDEPNRYVLPLGIDADDFVAEKSQSVAESFVLDAH